MKDTERMARALGWFSIGLGITEIVAPRALAKLIGMRDHRALPALGLREIASGIALLSQPDTPAWMWSRVGGDAMDLSLLGAQMNADNPDRHRAIAAAIAVAGVSAFDLICAKRLTAENQNGLTAHL